MPGHYVLWSQVSGRTSKMHWAVMNVWHAQIFVVGVALTFTVHHTTFWNVSQCKSAQLPFNGKFSVKSSGFDRELDETEDSAPM